MNWLVIGLILLIIIVIVTAIIFKPYRGGYPEFDQKLLNFEGEINHFLKQIIEWANGLKMFENNITTRRLELFEVKIDQPYSFDTYRSNILRPILKMRCANIRHLLLVDFSGLLDKCRALNDSPAEIQCKELVKECEKYLNFTAWIDGIKKINLPEINVLTAELHTKFIVEFDELIKIKTTFENAIIKDYNDRKEQDRIDSEEAEAKLKKKEQ